MEYVQSSHSIYKTEYHVVFVTKFRHEVLNPGFAKYTTEVIKDIASEMEGVEILEINIQTDHVHMYIRIPPKYAVSKVVEVLKSRSARIVRTKFEWMDKVYWGTLLSGEISSQS